MGSKSLWSLMRYMFLRAIIKDCNSVLSAGERAASSSRRPYSPNVHALVDVNSLLHREAHRVEDMPSGARMLAHAVRKRLDDAIGDPITSWKNPREYPMKVASLFVAVDGPPPLSKLLMQRERQMTSSKKQTKIVERKLRQASHPWNMGDRFLILTGNSDAIIHLLLAPPEFRTGILDLDEKDSSLNALWIAYQDVINSMAKTEEKPVLYLLDVAASKLNLETLALILQKAYLNTQEAEEHSSCVDLSEQDEYLEDVALEDLAVRKGLYDIPAQIVKDSAGMKLLRV
ncbi:hypothetical protein HDU81_001696 [Chytriomyces hyalinus]|nr:hypothetical protein HDU81_001696 [Chytriomyces hyalinus]